MRRFMVLLILALLMMPMLGDSADARPGVRGGGFGFRSGGFARPAFAGPAFRSGGFARPAFAGTAFRSGGFVRPAFAGAGIRSSGFVRSGFGRPALAGAGFVRPGFHGHGVRWGHRAGWRWRAAGVGLAFGALAAAPYYGWYGYSPYYDDCAPVPRQVWTGWGYRVVWVNTCEDYYY